MIFLKIKLNLRNNSSYYGLLILLIIVMAAVMAVSYVYNKSDVMLLKRTD